MRKNRFVLIHHHKYGDDLYFFQSTKDYTGYYSEENQNTDDLKPVVDKFDNLDFEPEREETIDIFTIEGKIKDID